MLRARPSLSAVTTLVQRRSVAGVPSSETQLAGTGGRSSVSGIVATVFGTTGFLGRYFVNKLGRMGSQVVVPFRGNEHDWRHLRPMGDLGQIVPKRFNPRDVDSIRRMVKGSNVVINLIGAHQETKNWNFEQTNHILAGLIAEASAEAKVERLIHVSALNASEVSSSKWLQSKARGEKAVLAAYPNATIVRPSLMAGQEDRFLRHLAVQGRNLGYILLPNSQRKVSPIYVGDVATGLRECVVNPSAAGKIFEFVGPDVLTMKEAALIVQRTIKEEMRVVELDSRLTKLSLPILDKLPLKVYSSEEYALSQVNEIRNLSLPGLEALGVVPARIPEVALPILRGFRKYATFGDPMESADAVLTAIRS